MYNAAVQTVNTQICLLLLKLRDLISTASSYRSISSFEFCQLSWTVCWISCTDQPLPITSANTSEVVLFPTLATYFVVRWALLWCTLTVSTYLCCFTCHLCYFSYWIAFFHVLVLFFLSFVSFRLSSIYFRGHCTLIIFAHAKTCSLVTSLMSFKTVNLLLFLLSRVRTMIPFIIFFFYLLFTTLYLLYSVNSSLCLPIHSSTDSSAFLINLQYCKESIISICWGLNVSLIVSNNPFNFTQFLLCCN